MGVVGRLVDVIAGILVPATCPSCRRMTVDATGLCGECWSGLVAIEYPICDRLGIPLAYADAEGPLLSAAALAEPPAFDRARAAVTFGPVARRLVHGLKYRDRLEIATLMGRMMARAGADLLSPDAVLVPIPLHRLRLLSRRYNQAALLAVAAARTVAEAARFRERAREGGGEDVWRTAPPPGGIAPAVAAGPVPGSKPADGSGCSPRPGRGVRSQALRRGGEPMGASGPAGGPRLEPDLLVRARPTESQIGLGREERIANVRNAFRVPDRARVEGRRVVLVDDVFTTGATVSAAATTLRRAGAAGVDVLTFARVVAGVSEPI